jgi:pyrroloquinoline quinone biosynthesis protein E
MSEAGSSAAEAAVRVPAPRPFWLLAELTYRCPLACPYCSNPLAFAAYRSELTTSEWLRVIGEARALGATQLGFSGGEPLLRKDLEELVAAARSLGYFTNLITSALTLDRPRLQALKDAGLDSVQVSFQASEQAENDRIAGCTSFARKLEAARLVKAMGLPLTLCVVIHRGNIERIEAILELCAELGADYVELASTQYYGWAKLNQAALLPSRAQVERAEAVSHRYQERYQGRMTIFYVVPDYHEERPKRCMNGWGAVFLVVAPDGTALPCHAARELPGLAFPNVRAQGLAAIWNDSPAFNRYRGLDWMREPCRSCPEKEKDLGGCRCQAWLLSGDAANADPVCGKSPHHDRVLTAVAAAEAAAQAPPGPAAYTYRTVANSRLPR